MKIETIIQAIERIQKRPVGFFYAVVTFLSVDYLRVLLEGVLESQHHAGYSMDPLVGIATISHYMLAFIVYFLTIILIIKITAGAAIGIRQVTRISLFCSPIIISPPLIDAVISRGAGYQLYYQFKWQNFLQVVVNAFNPFVSLPGISPGQRIEVFCVCLGAALYLNLLKDGYLRAVLSFMAIYLTICIYAFFPAVIGSIASLFITFEKSDTLSPGQELMLWQDGVYNVYLAHFRFAFVYLVMTGILLIFWWFMDRSEQQTQ